MKVQGPGRQNVGQVQERDPSQLKSLEQSKTVKTPEERIQVSNLSKLLSQARSSPDAPDMAKVERIRESLSAGTFKVDHELTAEAMLLEEI